MLPNDPAMLLSVVNTYLRDEYDSLAELCYTLSAPRAALEEKLASLGYVYDEAENRFVYREKEEIMNDCLFCKIAAGEIPSKKLYEDELCCAFYDIAPQAPVHFLVIPKAHVASCAEVDGGNSAIVAHLFEVIAKLAKEQGLASYRVVSNVGEQAGQSVPHLHFHVLAGRDMTWPPG